MSEPHADAALLQRDFSPDPSTPAYDQIVAALPHLRAHSAGEVTRPELFSRLGRPERDGPLCARIFGPLVDDSCLCGFITADPAQPTRCGCFRPPSRRW